MTQEIPPILDYCRVCGLPSVMRWEDLQHEICPCCGNHIGLDDIDLESARERRKEWLATGPTWWTERRSAPPNWDPIKQMENIPPEWR
jgi:hypothetical protein